MENCLSRLSTHLLIRRMYDLLIIDIVMPKMNGFELYEKVKEIDDTAKACFITAHELL